MKRDASSLTSSDGALDGVSARCSSQPVDRRLTGHSALSLVAWPESLGAVKVELGRIIAGATRDGLQKQSLVVARRQTFEDAPGEPVRTLVEYRYTFGPFVPGASFELVDLIAGLGTEQRDEIFSARRDEMHSNELGMLRDSVCVVLLRKADQEADGLDRALRCEADQATGTLAACGHRNDVHRVVDLSDPVVDHLEVSMRLPHSHPSQVTPAPRTFPT